MRMTVKKGVFAVLAGMLCAGVMAADITGAGATFPYPVYAKWAESYRAQSGNRLNYQSIGSGGGIRQIKAKTVDFGASDKPLDAAELEAAGLVQFPVILGGVVPVVNVKGIAPGQMRLSGPVIADIYLGRIVKWNAPQIAALNPGITLPDQPIVVVHRADGSGTSFLWTDFLSKTSADFREKVGAGTAVKWPTGVGGKGNEGVAANVQRIKGAIGYVEYAYARRNKIAHTQLLNRDGKFVQPDEASFSQAAAGADWRGTPGFGVILTNGAGWPVTGASFVLMQKVQTDPAKGQAVLEFFDWSFKNGGKMASGLDYVMLPPEVVRQVRQAWKASIKDTSGKAVW